MKQTLKWKNVGTPLLALVASLWLGMSTNSVFAADDTKQQLLELTGGRRVKVVWNQDNKIKLLDTKADAIQDLPMPCGSAPLISADGRLVFASSGKAPNDRAVMMYDTEKKKVTELAKGPGNNLLAVWTDPKTKRVWVYVNESGDHNENWNEAKGGKIFRFPVDKPEARELFWDRTSSHLYLMFSADGTRACFEPSWSNIGQLKLEFDAQGKVDQDKSTYKTFGGGCFPSMAPDNSYRLFRLDGDHHSVTMCDADNANQRKVKVDGMLTEEQLKKGRNTWLTRWSMDPRFITLVAPAGNDAQIWMGRFDEGFTKIEKWVRVSEEKGPQCWQSQSWVDPGKGKK